MASQKTLSQGKIKHKCFFVFINTSRHIPPYMFPHTVCMSITTCTFYILPLKYLSSSVECLHPQAVVHGSFDFRHLQRMVRHLAWQEHDTTSIHAFGIGSSVIRIGYNPADSHFHPILVTSRRCGSEQSAFFHIMHQLVMY